MKNLEKTNHKTLVIKAERWLLNTARCGVVFRELIACSGSGESPDAIGFRDGGHTSILIECKSSRADFLKDGKKFFRKHGGMGNYRYYLCEPGLIKPDELPEKWGLLYAYPKAVKTIVGRKSHTSHDERYWNESSKYEKNLMYSVLRRLFLRGHLESVYEPFNGGIKKHDS